MLSALFLINQKGEIIIYRLYRCAQRPLLLPPVAARLCAG